MKKHIFSNKPSLKKSKIHFDKIILALLIILGQVLTTEGNKVESASFSDLYYYVPGIPLPDGNFHSPSIGPGEGWGQGNGRLSLYIARYNSKGEYLGRYIVDNMSYFSYRWEIGIFYLPATGMLYYNVLGYSDLGSKFINFSKGSGAAKVDDVSKRFEGDYSGYFSNYLTPSTGSKDMIVVMGNSIIQVYGSDRLPDPPNDWSSPSYSDSPYHTFKKVAEITADGNIRKFSGSTYSGGFPRMEQMYGQSSIAKPLPGVEGYTYDLVLNYKGNKVFYDVGRMVTYVPKTPIPFNNEPILSIHNPKENSIYTKEEGSNIINVSGSVRDPDNDNVTVTAEIAGVVKSTVLTNTSASNGATFSFTFNVEKDNIPEGTHTVKVSITDGNIETPITATRNIIVQARVRHDAYVLVDSPLYYKTIYQDEENDPKYQEQYRYVHDPNYFKNSLGVLSDSNTWRDTTYNSLSLPGHYKVTYRAKDNPKNNINFDEFKMWSRESLSEINLYVHRKPIAVFKASINSSGTVTITDVDKSYDPDHQGETNNGIIDRQWRWRKIEDVIWNVSNNPPTSLTPGEEYILGLRVRDKDGENGIGVWSDWTDITLGTGSLAPLNALFTLNPNVVSHNPSKTITVTNLSSGPITRYEWIIRNSSGTQVGSTITTNVPTSAQLKQGGIGKYTLTLRVGDATRWSEPYTLPYEVINNPPIASFEAPDIVYRDTNISLVNTTPNDLDGDTISYQWKIKQPNGTEYNISTAKNPTFKIQNLITQYNINPVSAISKNWEIKLIATDAKGAKSEFTKDLEVINNVPEANINGPTSVMQYTTHNYMSNDIDADSGDNPLSIFRWKHIKPNGSFELYTTKDITVTFNEVGTHTLEHYVIDRIGDKSNVATLNVNVIENKAPSMVITSPNGTITKPTVISNDPLMQWNYSDTENDPQEKYSFDFYYADDDILEKTITNNDPTGNIREYQVPNGTFERFRPIKALGRVFSKYKWSELSNEVFFIINDAPIPGFTLDKHTIVRGEEIKVTSTAYDPNEIKGDFLTYKYYIKKLPNGPENLYTDLKDFTFTINTLTSNRVSDQYQIRQVVTDSLGVSSEHTEIFTVVNQKPNVEILEPSSSDKNNPYSYSDLKPTIRWIYSDLDGDSQKKYIVNIFEGDTNNLVVSSGEISSSSSSWTLPIELVEDKLYSVRVEVYDGHEWNISSTKYFKVFSLKISGYLVPNPAMAGDKIYFYITTEGYADKLEIVVPNDLIAMDKRVEMGYPAVSYPSLFFNVDKNVYKKEDILDYIVWVTTEETIDKNNVRLRQPYKFIIRAYKGEMTKEIELELDIKGNILELLKPGIKNKYGN